MFSVGDHVRTRPSGVSLLRIVEIEGDRHVFVEAVDDVPGRYPYSMPITDLVPADATEDAPVPPQS
jgi:hypothetical protein